MTQKLRHHNLQDDEQNYIDEECAECRKHMTDIKYIYVGSDDLYYCHNCTIEYDIVAVRCREL